MLRLLGLVGSLRRGSVHRTLLQAASQIVPEGISLSLYEEMDTLPYFCADLDFVGAILPPSVVRLRGLVCEHDGLLIVSPEYAHGVPGVLKNALDWLVSGPEFPGKPVALFQGALPPRGLYLYDSLREIILTMSGRWVEEACCQLPLTGKSYSAEDLVGDEGLSSPMAAALENFATAIRLKA